ncbi:hypothetical protein [Streptomyces sp. AcE210]|uniref:hypothetical protein n=1 Tax=Streptomyces sp. AcE210 TaxID=2292703 RepID=UPI000E307BC2|nr:hypothetical protein [Streptomyces sp. AcE210]RFC70304.1 hypothetical protein DXZ75_23350 [Streptomyces sp. AcE210]
MATEASWSRIADNTAPASAPSFPGFDPCGDGPDAGQPPGLLGARRCGLVAVVTLHDERQGGAVVIALVDEIADLEQPWIQNSRVE